MTTDPETSNCFFHYTTREAAFQHILPTGKLRFSTLERMRDPLENKEWRWTGAWFPDFSAPDPHAPEKAFMRFNELAGAIRQQAHLLALTIDATAHASGGAEFAKGWSRARMWEQYAEEHEGVCLIFDRDRLIASIGNDLYEQLGIRPYHGEVSYSETGSGEARNLNLNEVPLDVDSRFVASYIEDHHRDLFFQKALDWETEHEYRFVTTASPGKPLYAGYGVALIGVVVGERFPDWQRPAAIEAARKVGVEPMIMDWTIGRPIPTTLRANS